jgi:hypothetical protein
MAGADYMIVVAIAVPYYSFSISFFSPWIAPFTAIHGDATAASHYFDTSNTGFRYMLSDS